MKLLILERLICLIVISNLCSLSETLTTVGTRHPFTKLDHVHHNRMKNAQSSLFMDRSEIESALDFAQLTLQLKQTLRSGWVLRGVPRAESVADHSWNVTLLSLFLLRPDLNSPPHLDVIKCAQMALIHDLAECIVGDITPCDTRVRTKEEKQKLEQDAMFQIASFLQPLEEKKDLWTSEWDPRRHILELFHEYEERKSPEAIAVKDMDLLDLILQADAYETLYEQRNLNLDEFFLNTPPERFKTNIVRKYAEEVHRRRQRRWKEKHEVANETPLHDNMYVPGQAPNGLSQEDESFVLEFAATSTDLKPDDIRSVVQSLRARDRVVGK